MSIRHDFNLISNASECFPWSVLLNKYWITLIKLPIFFKVVKKCVINILITSSMTMDSGSVDLLPARFEESYNLRTKRLLEQLY
jgi:hypothetical protein